MQENRAHFELEDGKSEADQEVYKRDRDIGWIHGQVDSDNAEMDIVITDMVGNPQHTLKGVKFSNKRFGQRIDLPLTDNYCRIRVENVRNAKNFDIFVE